MRAFLAALMAVFLFGCTVPDENLRDVTVKVSLGNGHGSGVLVAPNLVLTAGHVGQQIGNRVLVEFFDGKIVPGIVSFVSDERSDHALIALLHPVKITPAKLRCELPRFDEDLRIVGFPLSTEWAITRGKKSADVFRRDQKNDYYMIDATTIFGNSGGPVFDAMGRIVGIISAIPGSMTLFGPVFVSLPLAVNPETLCKSLGAYL